MSKKNETDLAKAHQFAVPFNDFKALVVGDLHSAINLMHYLAHNEEAREIILLKMYNDYVQTVSERNIEDEKGGKDE